MASGKETDENSLYDVILSDDDFSDLAAHLGQPVNCFLEGSFGGHATIVVQKEFSVRDATDPYAWPATLP
jgi:hypothetical protein